MTASELAKILRMREGDGGPAFPTSESHGDDYEGMALRDYFAAKAMQGLIAQSMGAAGCSDPVAGAQYAYAMADAMLKARNV